MCPWLSSMQRACAVLYCICALSGSTTFFHHFINGTIFGKNLMNMKYVFLLSLQLPYGTFLTLRRIHWHIITNVYRSSGKVPVIFQSNLYFLNRFSKNTHHVKCHENPSRGSRLVPSGRTDGWTDKNDEANSRFYNCAKVCHKFTRTLKLAPNCSFLSNVTQ